MGLQVQQAPNNTFGLQMQSQSGHMQYQAPMVKDQQSTLSQSSSWFSDSHSQYHTKNQYMNQQQYEYQYHRDMQLQAQKGYGIGNSYNDNYNYRGKPFVNSHEGAGPNSNFIGHIVNALSFGDPRPDAEFQSADTEHVEIQKKNSESNLFDHFAPDASESESEAERDITDSSDENDADTEVCLTSCPGQAKKEKIDLDKLRRAWSVPRFMRL